ncbi:MAG: hypothetical protein VX527_06860 [Planctomycetota bacterium]|nr:hypothetical protein [Planctomycetota bacterium]
MTYEEDKLKSIWLARQQDPAFELVDENAVAAWLDDGCPENEAVESSLASNRPLREAVSAIRLDGNQAANEFVPEGTRQHLLAHVLEAFQPKLANSERSPVIGSIGLRMAAAAAAIVVAALGFSFGRVAAPATNQATNDFVAVVTFDMLTEDDNLDSILMGTALAIDIMSEGDAQ